MCFLYSSFTSSIKFIINYLLYEAKVAVIVVLFVKGKEDNCLKYSSQLTEFKGDQNAFVNCVVLSTS